MPDSQSQHPGWSTMFYKRTTFPGIHMVTWMAWPRKEDHEIHYKQVVFHFHVSSRENYPSTNHNKRMSQIHRPDRLAERRIDTSVSMTPHAQVLGSRPAYPKSTSHRSENLRAQKFHHSELATQHSRHGCLTPDVSFVFKIPQVRVVDAFIVIHAFPDSWIKKERFKGHPCS